MNVTNQTPKFYTESNNFSPIGLGIGMLILLGLALLMGYVYSCFVIFIPVIYFNVLLTAGLGMGLGLACRFLSRLSKTRSRQIRLLMAVIAGLAANYFQWTVYILYAFQGSIPSFNEFLANLYWLVVPQSFVGGVGAIYNVGLWQIFGIQFNGWALAFVWFLEFFIIAAVTFAIVYKMEPFPFAEYAGKWYRKHTLIKDFQSVVTVDALTHSMASNPLEAIRQMGKGSGNRHAKVHLYFLPEEAKQYVTVENIFIESNGKKNITNMINNLEVDSDSAKEIMQEFHHKKEFFDVF